MTLPQNDLFSPFQPRPQAPARKKYLVELFNKFAADTLKDFPELRGGFMLIDGATGKAIGDVDPDRINGKTTPQELADDISAMYKKMDPSGGYADAHPYDQQNNHFLLNDGEVNAIRFYKSMDVTGDPEKDALFALEHELGHIVVPGGHGTRAHLGEEAGDLLATLKYIQRHGEASVITLVGRTRGKYLLMGDVMHFTNPALQQLAREYSISDIQKMTPSQMTELSGEIADKTQYTAATLHDVGIIQEKLFTSLAERYRTSVDNLVQNIDQVPFSLMLKQVAALMLDKSVYASEFKMGMAVLIPYMQDVPGHALPQGLEGQEWDMMKRSLLTKAQTVQPAPVEPKTPKARLPMAFPVPEDRPVQAPRPQMRQQQWAPRGW